MRNSDMPAMPIPNGADGRPWSISDMGHPGHVFGLTKREHFAGLAMNGILANGAMVDQNSDEGKWVAEYAVQCADALLNELEKEFDDQ